MNKKKCYALGFSCNSRMHYLKSREHKTKDGEVWGTQILFTTEYDDAKRFSSEEVIVNFNQLRKAFVALEIMEVK